MAGFGDSKNQSLYEEAIRELFEEYRREDGRGPFHVRFAVEPNADEVLRYAPGGAKGPAGAAALRSSVEPTREERLEGERDYWKNRALNSEDHALRRERGYAAQLIGLRSEVAVLRGELAQRGVGGLSRETVTKILKYVHPDKNGGSEEAKVLTQALLAIRPKG